MSPSRPATAATTSPVALAVPTPAVIAAGHRPSAGVALVTGAGRGIGRLLAEALARQGRPVGLVARSADELATVRRAIETAGGTAVAMAADVTDRAALAGAVAEIRRRLGPIELLVNNAGILGPIGPVWELDVDDWWSTLDVNLRGLLVASQLVLPEMVARKQGRIVNVTSQAGVHRWPLVSAYSVSKAAVVKLTENLARETERHGISVFSVHPGFLPIGITEAFAGRPATSRYEEVVRRWADAQFRAGGTARPEDAVALVLRLATGDADALSGLHLSVHDDVDTVLARAAEVRARDLYVLRPQRLAPAGEAAAPAPVASRADSGAAAARRPAPARSALAPAYFQGRPAALFLRAYDRRLRAGFTLRHAA
jgi:NAD(P)-dependent dehydrogenase (short-subunit alcohol dehydrogenase family)